MQLLHEVQYMIGGPAKLKKQKNPASVLSENSFKMRPKTQSLL